MRLWYPNSTRDDQLTFSLFLISIFLVFSPVDIIAQYDFSNPTYFNVSDGIPSNTVYSINQDDDGYIWIGTEGGVCSFDGSSFKVFGEEQNLFPHIVAKTEFDNQKRLWLNTFGNLRYIQDFKVHYFNGIASPDLSWSFGVCNTTPNDLWLIMTNQVRLFDSKTLKEKPFPFPEMQNSERIKLLLGNANGVAYIYENYRIYAMNEHEVVDSFIVPIIGNEDFYNRINWHFDYPKLYFNSKSGIVAYDFEKRKEKIVDPGFINSRDVFFKDGTFYLTDKEKGLWLLNTNEDLQVIRKEKYLSKNFINQIYFDDKDNFWITTHRDGLILFPKQRAQIAQNIPIENKSHSLDFNSVVHDPQGNLWAGSFEGILTKFSKGNQVEFKTNNRVMESLNRLLDIKLINEDSILITSDENLYLFTNDRFKKLIYGSFKSLCLFKDSVLVTSSSYTGSAKIQDLIINDDNYIVPELNEAIQTILPLANLGRSYASLYHEGYYWFTNVKEGLTTNDPRYKTKKIKNAFKTIRSTVKDFMFYKDILIICTSGQGVFLLKDEILLNIGKKNGLSSDFCNSVKVVDGIIYVATNTGLNIVQILDWESKNIKIDVIEREDGLKSSEVVDLSIFADELICATRKGLSRISLTDIKNRPRKELPVLISEVTCNNLNLPIQSSYVLESDQNNIQVKFNVIDFERKNKVIFAYRMKGDQSEWQMTTSKEINYNNLLPGKYEFQLGVVGTQNKDIELRQKFDLEIKSPITQRMWFKWLSALMIIFLLFLIFVSYSDQVQKEKLRTQVESKTLEIEEKLTELGLINEKLEASNKELQSFTYITSHDLKSPLRNIHTFVELLNRKNQTKFDDDDREYISIVLSGAKRMSSIIDDLLTLSKLRVEVSYVDVDLNQTLKDVLGNIGYFGETSELIIQTEGELPTVKFSSLKANQLFQNLIENGIKYNNSTPKIITISSEENENFWIIKIADNGIGINKKHHDSIFEVFRRLHVENEYSGTGIGLAICQRIMDSQNGQIRVVSEPGKGTTFIIEMNKKMEDSA